jgi:hypothetical protein
MTLLDMITYDAHGGPKRGKIRERRRMRGEQSSGTLWAWTMDRLASCLCIGSIPN